MAREQDALHPIPELSGGCVMEWITRVMVVLFVRLLARAEQVALNTGDPLRDSAKPRV